MDYWNMYAGTSGPYKANQAVLDKAARDQPSDILARDRNFTWTLWAIATAILVLVIVVGS